MVKEPTLIPKTGRSYQNKVATATSGFMDFSILLFG